MRHWAASLARNLPRRLLALCASPPSPSTPQGRRAIALARVAVLASSVALMLPGAWGHSVTVVEFAQLPAGLAAWQRGSLGVYRVCGPASKLLYALPAHLAGVRVDYPASFDADLRGRREWELGRLFQKQNREGYHSIYRWSRLMPILVTILGGCLVCEWSTRLFGTWPGIAAMSTWLWMPSVLAHGSLVTSDVLSAVVTLLAARSFWVFLLAPRPGSALLAGLALGLAVATKFTLLVLYPCWAVLVIGRAVQLRSTRAIESVERLNSPSRLLGLSMAVLVCSLAVMNSFYTFKGVGAPLADWRSGRSSLSGGVRWLGEQRATAWLLHAPMPVPSEYVRGLDFQLADAERPQTAYLLGRTRLGGWWYWYAIASLIKIPLPVLILFGVALMRVPSIVRGRGPIAWALLCLLFLALEMALMISAATGTGTNAAFRYIIPSLGLVCISVGCVWHFRSMVGRLALSGLLGWLAVNALVGVPDHLGWQNELGWIWGRLSGRPALIGDSLDWGQDIARLGDWVARHAQEGDTLIGIYGLGEGEPYGLRSPSSRTISDVDDLSVYLAVSEECLLGSNITNYVFIDNKTSQLSQYQCDVLLEVRPCDRVGRSIRIYRLRDLPSSPQFFPVSLPDK